jgi:AraC family transcriptional regulator
MEYSIKTKPEMTFVGYTTVIDVSKGQGFEQIPKLWSKVMEENLFNGLMEYKDDIGAVGISYDYEMNTGNFKYMIGVRSNTDKLPNTEKLHLSEQEYGIFKSVGKMPTAIQQTIQYIHKEWLPTSEYRHTGNAEIEVYPDGNTHSDEYVSYVWVTIAKK